MMLAGKIYDPQDGELKNLRARAHALCARFNTAPETKEKLREKILDGLLPVTTEPAPITQPEPIFAPARIVTLPAIQQLSPIVMGTPYSLSVT